MDLLNGKRSVTERVSAVVTRDWQEIAALVKGGSLSQLKQALIVADKSLDSVLKDLVAGEAMGERLKNAKQLFHPQTYDKLWQAHKLRNALVHESGFEVQSFILKAATESFRSALRELGLKL
jgi:hypothetical protein